MKWFHYSRLYYLLLIATLSASCLHAQFTPGYDFKFKTYTTQDGLVHNYTKKCRTDSKGFLWIITQHGLSRFDGLNFRNFEHIYNDPASLPENDLEDIAIDNNDHIWLSYKTGLCYYDQAAHVFTVVRPVNQVFSSYSVLYDHTRNCIWSINYEGFTRIDSKNFSIQTYPYKQPITTRLGIENCYLDSEDRLWIPMDRRGYYTIQLATNKQYYYDQDIWPMQVFEDGEKQVWMTTWSSGFRKINITGETHQHTLFKDPYVSKYDPFGEIYYGITESIPLSGKDLLWIANSTNGIIIFDKKEGKFTREFRYDANIKNGIATNFNNTAYTDPNGIVWICTWHGLTKINKQEQQFNSRELPFLKTRYYNRLSGIQDDPYNNNILWLGIEGSGLMKFNKLTNTPLERYFFLSGQETPAQEDFNFNWRWVESMFTDSKKNIWATAYGGLIKITNGVVKKMSCHSIMNWCTQKT